MPRTDIHPDLRRLATLTPRGFVGPRTLRLARAGQTLVARMRTARHGVEAITLSSGTRLRLFRSVSATEPGPALLWIHGGGYVLGDARQDDALCQRFSDCLGATVASVDYRLAPEHPYPAPLEDCYAVLHWLTTLSAVDPQRIAIGGASAGGGLAAALALLARDRSEIAPAFQLLVYPMLDDRSSQNPSNPNFRLWNPRSNAFGWSSYLGAADPGIAVPSRRDDLEGLAPAWIGIGTNDLFYPENLAYAQRLKAAGVPCDVEVVEGAFHGFDALAPTLPVSQRFFAKQCDAVRAGLGVR